MKSKLERLLQDFTLRSIYDAIYLPLRSGRSLGDPTADRSPGISPFPSAANR